MQKKHKFNVKNFIFAFVCMMFLGQSAWGGVTKKLKEKTSALNKSLKEFNTIHYAAEKKIQSMMGQCGSSPWVGLISFCVGVPIIDEPCIEVQKKLEKKIDDYFNFVAENPKVVVNVQPDIDSVVPCVAKKRLKEIIRAKWKSALKKCMNQRFSNKYCEQAFRHTISSLLEDEEFIKELFN